MTEVSHQSCFNKTPTALSKLFKSQRNASFFCLIDYFSQHLGEYENVLAALEDLNLSILKAMDKTKKVSQHLSIFKFGRHLDYISLFLCDLISSTSGIYRCEL